MAQLLVRSYHDTQRIPISSDERILFQNRDLKGTALKEDMKKEISRTLVERWEKTLSNSSRISDVSL